MTRRLTRDRNFSKTSRPVIDFTGLPVVLVSYFTKYDLHSSIYKKFYGKKVSFSVITVAKEDASCSNKMETLVLLFKKIISKITFFA